MGWSEIVLIVLVVCVVIGFLARRSSAAAARSLPPLDGEALIRLATEAQAVRDSSGDVAAIKHVRERTGWGLVEAKTYVDRLG
jgi:ribosomal protein L7/L12